MVNPLYYFRADTYTPWLCDHLTDYATTAYHAGKSAIHLVKTSPLKGPLAKVGAAVHQAGVCDSVRHAVDTSKNFLAQYPAYDIFLRHVNAVPVDSKESFCSWVDVHSVAASDVITDVLHVPERMLSNHTTQMLLRSVVVYSFVLFVMWALLYALYGVLDYFFADNNAKKPRDSLYLFGIEVFKAFKPEWGVTVDQWYDKQLNIFHQTPENADFVKRVCTHSGINVDGPTYFPPEISSANPTPSIEKARAESMVYITTLLEACFANYHLTPNDIDVLVINCSLFNPTPSHCALAINHFKMRTDIICYAIHGMGCSASAIAVNSCRDALWAHPKPNPVGVVISFENLTMNLYTGKERSMLVPNSLFRMGAAAMVFGTQPTFRRNGYTVKAQYKLDQLIRTHIGRDDNAAACIYHTEDAEGKTGVRLSKDVPKVASKALTINVSTLAKRILPVRVLLSYVIRAAWAKFTGSKKVVTPNFLSVIDHVCVHAGGRGVIDAIQKDFDFPDAVVQDSREVLFKYGNQSSASIWYIFDLLHHKVRRGQKVWQITFGSGFKSNSLVWTRL